MYYPKRSYEDVSVGKIEHNPMRALTGREQTLLDATVIVNDLSLNKDLGYFVSRCIHGDPCANDVHGLHYQTNA